MMKTLINIAAAPPHLLPRPDDLVFTRELRAAVQHLGSAFAATESFESASRAMQEESTVRSTTAVLRYLQLTATTQDQDRKREQGVRGRGGCTFLLSFLFSDTPSFSDTSLYNFSDTFSWTL